MNSVPAPEIEPNRSFNLLTSIWIVPLIALIVSGWLVYQHYANLGSEIQIDFAHSDNLIAGESVVKFRDAPIGKVMRITIQEDGEGVTVFIRMNREAEPYLNPSSHFWIVSPQVDANGIRGLDTLISGAYIAMQASRKGKLVSHFKGDEKPYRGAEEGHYFYLQAKAIGNIHVGAPVYYHDLQVGNIDKITLSHDKVNADMTIFIKKEYVSLINTTTKFWHQDLVALSMDGGEIALNLAPITSVLLGGISFETKFEKPYPRPDKQHRFYLYNKHSLALQKKIGGSVEQRTPFVFEFAGAISGLREGAPIRYQGFRVGEVEKVNIAYDSQSRSMQGQVLGMIDLSMFEDHESNGSINLHKAVAAGLHAELKGNNPLVDTLYIDLTYSQETNATHEILVTRHGHTLFPTKKMVKNEILSKLDHLMASITALADENRQPLHDLLDKLKESADHLNAFMKKESFQNLTDDFNKTMGGINGFMGKSGDLNKALAELRKTLDTTKRVMRGYSSGSLFGKKLEAMLREVGRTSEETKRFIEKLNKKPNALIFGE